MSTRKLIALALACGMAILVAGAWQLFNLKVTHVDSLALGQGVAVSGVEVTLSSVRLQDGQVVVAIALKAGAAAIDDPAARWSLANSSNSPIARSGSDCADGGPLTAGQSRSCVVRFDPAGRSTTGLLTVRYNDSGRTAIWSVRAA
jgi:hypothetical protein